MYANILVAVDGSEASKYAVSEAIRIARLSGGKLTAVHVLDRSAAFMYAGACDPHLLTDTARHAGRRFLDEACARMQEFDVTGDSEIVETQGIGEDVASCLARCATRLGAELVVIGTHGRRGMRRMVIGSVAERFVRQSTCPVLLIRETWTGA